MDEVGRLPWINEDEIVAKFPTIFHYTRAKHLEPILASRGLHATHFAHTNDAEEFHGVREMFPALAAEPAIALAKRLRAKGAFKRAPSNAALAEIIPEDARNFHDAMVRALPLPFYLTCFSKHTAPHHNVNGLLTLWRFYGGDGEGVALGFDTRRLVGATETLLRTHALTAIYLDEVRYGIDDEVLRARMSDATGLLEMFLEFVDNLISGRQLDFGKRGLEMRQFTVLAASAKHPDFMDEREIRLVATPAFEGHEDGRESARTSDERFILLPYLDALESVIVGPSRDQAGLAERIGATLERAGYADVEVVRSKTPFRFVQR
jgi:hypothetical protein